MSASAARKAACGCGRLSATVRGEPMEVYACSCLDCQRYSGSSFTYCALYPENAVAIAGDSKTWRHLGDSGRWVESGFCPTCGVSVIFRMQAVPNVVGVSAGCFADPHFGKPTRLYWASRQHDWLSFPEDVERLATQPE